MVLLGMTTLALAGCGRKGGLDLPTASAQPTAAVEAEAERAASPGILFAPQPEAGPAAAKGTKRAFVLDPLLN